MSEAQSKYITESKHTPAPKNIYCSCGRLVGREMTVSWYNKRKGRMSHANILVLEAGGVTVKLYVRGEVECGECGEKVVWNG